ncbi:MAG: hypothetical protein AB7T49_14140 [Oligoflexales bacterium]
MSTATNKSPTVFAQAALTLDEDFQEFDRLAKEIERQNIESDTGFERAAKLLIKLDSCGKRISSGMQTMSSALEEVRARTEQAANVANTRAVAVQERQQLSEQMMERLQHLGDTVRKITTAVGELRQSSDMISDEDRAVLAERLPEFNAQLGMLVDEVQKLKVDATAAHMRTLERNADSLKQSLQRAKHKLSQLTEGNIESRSIH